MTLPFNVVDVRASEVYRSTSEGEFISEQEYLFNKNQNHLNDQEYQSLSHLFSEPKIIIVTPANENVREIISKQTNKTIVASNDIKV